MGVNLSRNEIDRYGTWYDRIRAVICERFGNDADLFIDLLAATSPRQHVRRNWRTAVKVYREYKSGYGVRWDDLMASHWPNVLRALRHEPLSGPKVQRFAANLRGDTDCVTVDTWICRAYGVEPKGLTPAAYAGIEQDIRQRAGERGVAPAAYQAALWQVQRQTEGRKAVSFLAAVDDERQMTLWEE